MARVSIGIPVYNSKDFILGCLSSIYQSIDPGLDFEVIVVDDGSTDGTASAIETQFPQVKLLRNKKNEGIVASRTKVILESTGDYFLRLDADTKVYPGSISELVSFLEKNSGVGVVGPMILDANKNIDFTSFGMQEIGVGHVFKDYSFLLWKFFRKIHSLFRKPLTPAHPLRVNHLLGAAFMVRRQAIQQAGLPKSNITNYREETDWLYTIAKFGWEIWYDPQAKIMHYGGSTNNNSGKIYIHGEPNRNRDMWRFIYNHYPQKRQRPLFFVSILSASVLSLFLGVLLIPFVWHQTVRTIFIRTIRTYWVVVTWHIKNFFAIMTGTI